MKAFEDKVMQIIAEKAMTKLDMDDIVEKMLPKLTKSLEKKIVEIMEDWDFTDTVIESGFMDDLAIKIIKEFKKKLKV